MRSPPGAPTLGHAWKPAALPATLSRLPGIPWPAASPIERSRHEVGNPASLRPALRLRNHDVHFHPLKRTAATRRRYGLTDGVLAVFGSRGSRDAGHQDRPSRMRVHVLGSAAGGGFPQWNCNCRNCDGVRKGTLNAKPRTQSSIAVSADGANWLLCNASPDILAQLRAAPMLQPARTLRDTAIRALLLVDAQIDHTTGLYMLREHRQPLDVWCTDPVHEDLESGNPLFHLLGHYCGVVWHRIPIGGEVFVMPTLPGLAFTAHPLISNAPPYSPRRDRPVPGDNIALEITDLASNRTLFYAPGLCEIGAEVRTAIDRKSVV